MWKTKAAPFLFTKRGIFYFSRRIPADLAGHYRCDRITISLRTKSLRAAQARAAALGGKLDQDWLSLRWQSKEDQFSRFLSDRVVAAKLVSSAPTLSEAAKVYVEEKGKGRPQTFHQAVDRVVSRMIAVAGDKPIDTFTREEANALRNAFRAKGLTTASIKRAFNVIRAMVNFVAREVGLDEIRTFSSIYFGEDEAEAKAKRSSFGDSELKTIQVLCRELDDQPRWLIGLISDSGMRLAEAAGLVTEDVVLDDKHPHIKLRPHPWRSLKTQGSARIIPLVGVSLWAAQRAVSASTNGFLFPKYCNDQECKANSASAALNKWMSPRVSKGGVVHSFRHSLRDRLRAVECPRDIVDRLGGWTVDGIGETYGKGYPIQVLHKWMEMIV
ncbi:hypothetical protein A6A04_14690 [Paramagnetospirillum marisnigri]|uniref:Tyr recombinase domain-containing protein n=1 Tax=Paramagnetospirillum marisnigri TaxID=1285242 RepID=A0A178MTG0_9PROT|nr:DUF6538 domain-containing protein [Paramagnetospirillum marisnigri]OAN52968.1 hypothetical protein A6A04_14690 [Paramagnetospirillum marisnigri]